MVGVELPADPWSVVELPAEANAQWLSWLRALGMMGSRVADFDWAHSSLGSTASWPPMLRAAVTLCLSSKFPSSIWWGPELVVIYNDACRAVYGEDRFREALGRPATQIWPETVPSVASEIASVFQQGQAFFAVDRPMPVNRSVPNEETFFTFGYTPVAGADGRIEGMYTTYLETTRQVLAERRLRVVADVARRVLTARSVSLAAHECVDALAGNLADHFFVEVFTGRPDGGLDAAGRRGEASVPVAETSGTLAARCVEAGTEQSARTTDGTVLHAVPGFLLAPRRVGCVLVLAEQPVRPWDDALAEYAQVCASQLAVAMAAQQELSDERGRVAAMAELDAAKSAFFANVSHELRTPLALISGPVQTVLEQESGLTEHARSDLGSVLANVDRLARTVDALLDFSRIDAGRVTPNLEPVAVERMLRDLATMFGPALERSGVRFDVDIPDLSRRALLDRDVFERVVSNLLSNALKFTPEGGSVRLSVRQDRDDYVIEIADTGIGIAEVDLPRVFQRFEQLQPRPGARTGAGAGIGLAMVKNLTELLGGHVHVSSAPNRGSTFTVRLPFEPRVSTSGGRSITPRRVASFLAELEPPAASTTEQPAGFGERLLIVEDDPQMASFLARTLADSYRVEVASDGAAALAMLRANPPAIVLSDVSMPGLTGLQLVELIRAHPDLHTIPVVLLSARAGDADASAGLGSGADDYLSKPFSVLELKARLAANLTRSRERIVDAAWRRAVVRGIRDAVVLFDRDGSVLEVNQAFIDMLGYSLADGPMTPPHPWWPTEHEDAQALAHVEAAFAAVKAGTDVEGEFTLYRKDRAPVWVWSSGAIITNTETGHTAALRTLRDITRERDGRRRRTEAAAVVRALAGADDLDTLIGIAVHGLSVLFDGTAVVQLGPVGTAAVDAHGAIPARSVSSDRSNGAWPEPESGQPTSGLLLHSQEGRVEYRAWVDFPVPRTVNADELVVAELISQAFSLALDQLLAQQGFVEQRANLEQAIESHRAIGQAVGILVERHRVRPADAFERLKQASKDRNTKLRIIAERVVETGLDPESA